MCNASILNIITGGIFACNLVHFHDLKILFIHVTNLYCHLNMSNMSISGSI